MQSCFKWFLNYNDNDYSDNYNNNKIAKRFNQTKNYVQIFLPTIHPPYPQTRRLHPHSRGNPQLPAGQNPKTLFAGVSPGVAGGFGAGWGDLPVQGGGKGGAEAGLRGATAQEWVFLITILIEKKNIFFFSELKN